MQYSIFRNNTLIVSVPPDDSSELSQKKQSEDIVRLNFRLDSYVIFQIGDYINYGTSKYVLNKLPRVIETPFNYQYECIFEGTLHELRKTKVFLQTPKSVGFYKDYKFPLTGTAATFLEFIVSNLNRTGSGYTVGSAKETNSKTIEFNNWNAFEAISQLSTELSFGWYIENKKLHFTDRAINTAYVFQVGRHAGFVNLTRNRVDSENIQTVVYGYGSTKNLPPRSAEQGITYDSELLIENRLSFSGVNEESKLQNNIANFGIIETVKEFDIMPERVGIVSAISEDLNSFFDSSIDFDINSYLIAGIEPKLTFLTGKLINLSFGITYDNSLKKITLTPYYDSSGSYPNSLISIGIGDTYILTDISMPQSYIDAAKVRLQQATQDYLDMYSKNLELYEAEVDSYFLEKNNLSLNLGDVIRVISTVFGIDNGYEIKELVRNLNNPFQCTIKFGDVLSKSLVNALKNINFTTQNSIYTSTKNIVNTVNNTTINQGETVAWQSL